MSKIELIDEGNPWTKKSDKVVYDNPWIHVREHQVIDPSGNNTIYGVVSAKMLAVGIIPLDNEYNTWLVGQYRYPLHKYSWEIIEGGGKFDVDPLESAKRELKEEGGLEAKQWTKILEMQTSNCISDEQAHIFIAKDLIIGKPEPDENERLQLVKVPFDEAYRLVMDGRILDGMSVGGILKTKILIDRGEV